MTPADARSLNREVFAAYVELSSELAKSVFADIAGRYEHYSDAGSSVAGKAALRWEFTRGFALRGSVSILISACFYAYNIVLMRQ